MNHLKLISQISIYILAYITFVIITCIASKACTVFNKSNGDTVLFGNVENDSEDWVAGLYFEPPNKTLGQYGHFYIYLDYNIAGGMNDQGLCFDVAGLPEHPIQSGGKDAGDLMGYLLRSCATLEDALNFFDTHYWTALSFNHLMVMDISGASVVIEQIEDSLYIFRKDNASQVMTNYSFANPDIRYGSYPCNRNNLAHNMLDTMSLTVDNMRKVCESVEFAYYHALYATIYEPKKMEIHVFDATQPGNITTFNLIEENHKGSHYYILKNKKIVSGLSQIAAGTYSVSFNVPNPFYVETSFSLNLLKNAEVNISILDIHGRCIAVLDIGRKSPGSYSYTWQTEPFSSGIYFCRFSIDGIVETRKWIKQ